MRSQIRAPKARKVNSYSSFGPKENSGIFEDFNPSDKNIRLVTRNSESNLHGNLLGKFEENACLESFESEIEEHATRISALNEISRIVCLSQPNNELRSSVGRCLNPFSRNFEATGKFTFSEARTIEICFQSTLKDSSEEKNVAKSLRLNEEMNDECNKLH